MVRPGGEGLQLIGVHTVTEQDQQSYLQTIEIRGQATDLLHRLIADQRRCEQRLAQGGGRDPLKSLTGRSAIDRAIDETRRLITDMDCMLDELNRVHCGMSLGAGEIEVAYSQRLEPAAV
jgi:hypothetical protein